MKQGTTDGSTELTGQECVGCQQRERVSLESFVTRSVSAPKPKTKFHNTIGNVKYGCFLVKIRDKVKNIPRNKVKEWILQEVLIFL